MTQATTPPAAGQPDQPLQPPPPIAAVPKPFIRWSLVVLSLIGWWLSLGLYRLSLGVPSGNPLLAVACGQADDGQRTACESVLASRWARVELAPRPGAPEIPTAAFGMAYFAVVGFWYLLIGPPTRSRWPWHFIIVVLVGIGIWQSVAYTLLMHSVLRQWCVGCAAVHVVNGLIGVLTLAAFPWRREEWVYEPHPRGRLVVAVFLGGMLLALLHGGKALLDQRVLSSAQAVKMYRQIVTDPEFIRWDHQRQPRVSFEFFGPAGDDAWVGPADAPHEVVAFLDYQCTACRQAHDALREAQQRYPDLLRIRYVNYPLGAACNPHVTRDIHPHACKAASAAEAARALGGTEAFVKMHDRLYDEQVRIPAADYASWAGEIGLRREAFVETMNAPQVAERIAADIEAAHQAGVSGTPTVYLDGRRVRHPLRADTWAALLGEAGGGEANATGDEAAAGRSEGDEPNAVEPQADRE